MRPERGGVEDLPQHTFEAKVSSRLVRDAARKEGWDAPSTFPLCY
jgi:hypothetical protein